MAGRQNTTGQENAVFGEDAFQRNINGNSNTMIGSDAGHWFVGGNANTFIGNNAGSGDYLHKTSNGGSNVAVGYFAGDSLTTGSSNVIIGSPGGGLMTTGSYNVIIGTSAWGSNKTANSNVIIGYSSANANVSGNQNTTLGYYSLRSGTTGSRCVALGYGAGTYETGNDKLFIDDRVRASESDARAKALIYGIFDDYVASQRLTINARVIIPQVSAALTDGAPTDNELDSGIGITAANVGAGFKVIVKDNNGSGLLYLVESDGTDWFYVVMTKAL